MLILLALNCTVRWSYVRPTYVGTVVSISRGIPFALRIINCQLQENLCSLYPSCFFVVVLSFPCILYFQVSLHSIGCPNNILSSQILSFKLLVRYLLSDSQNLVFVLKTVLLHCTSYTVLAFPSLTLLLHCTSYTVLAFPSLTSLSC